MFLIKEDYSSQVREEVLDILTNEENEALWQDAELKAQAMMESYINHRYDVAAIFIDVSEWNSSSTWNVDEHVVHLGKVYYALLANTNSAPADGNANWQLGDKRNRHIIRLMVDITLYILYTSNNARAIPQHVQDKYDYAIEWLTKVSKAIIGPGLPTLPEDVGNPVKWGSEPKQTHYW